MALFRRLFYRKPPDHLLEISERVYVFDCCFSMDILEEHEYRGYMSGIVGQLQDYFPDASFMVFNFREGDKRSQISDILSQYDMTVMDYPRQYEGCPLLPLEMIHHFLRSSESWLSLEGQQNVLLMHCERGGWPVLAFMLAGLLLYRKQYTGEQKTLEMVYKQAPKELLHLLSPLNPQPSQLRYLQYISRRGGGLDWPPQDTPLALDCLILRVLPNFGTATGCRPMVRVYGQDPLTPANRSSKVLFSTPKTKKHIKHHKQGESAPVKINIHCRVQGDVVLECIHLDEDLEREEMLFRVMFNTAFVQSNNLVFNRDEIDVLWNAKDRFPRDIKVEVLFSDSDLFDSDTTVEIVDGDGNETEGASGEEFFEAEEIFSGADWLEVKRELDFPTVQNSAKPVADRKQEMNTEFRPMMVKFVSKVDDVALREEESSLDKVDSEIMDSDHVEAETTKIQHSSILVTVALSTVLESSISETPVKDSQVKDCVMTSGSSGDVQRQLSNSQGAAPPPPPPFGARTVGGSQADTKVAPLNSVGVRGRGPVRPASSSASLAARRSSLKPLHWVKVTRAVQGSLWAELQRNDEASSATEFDVSEIESLFSAVVPKKDDGSGAKGRRKSVGSKTDKVHLIDLRRANNCEIMLTKVKMPLSDMMGAALALDDSILDVDQVENLIKFCPTKEEMELLKGYNGDKENLGKCEQFFLELMKVPRVESKLRVFSFKIQFGSQISDFRKSLNSVNSACDEIKSSVKLKEVMKRILQLGNTLNQGTARGSAIGFKLDSLLKLIDTRASNSKMTLMHYLCKVLASRSPHLLNFHKDLVSLDTASKIQLKYLAEEMQAITKGLEKVEQELNASENDGPVSDAFRKGRNADALVLYFGEDPARCPFEQAETKFEMRKHGWQLPYHPLQVVAIAVFLALGFAFYVFFLPFVGRKIFQYVVIGLYTPLVTCVFCLYVWCAAANPADPGVFRSKKYLNIVENEKPMNSKEIIGETTSSVNVESAAQVKDKKLDGSVGVKSTEGKLTIEEDRTSSCYMTICMVLFGWCPFTRNHPKSNEQGSEQHTSEEGMFYCSLCEVELILQWSSGILVLIRCFVERKQFSVEINSKLGSSFSLLPFVVVVGISTYDYIVAMREQEQQGAGVHQSPQMSPASSFTGLSSASSFNAFHRGAWCTPPRLFLEDQFDVIPPDAGMSIDSSGKRIVEESARKKNTGNVKINPWTLARLNAEEVSKAAAEARKKSKILQPVVRRDVPLGQGSDSSFGSSSGRMAPRPDNRRRINKRGRIPLDLPSNHSLKYLQLEARSAFRMNRAMSSTGIVASSPDSSTDSPELHPFHASSSGMEGIRGLMAIPSSSSSIAAATAQKGIQLSRSTSDGYDASGGEDSDRVPTRIVHRSSNWNNVLFNSDHDDMTNELKAPSSSVVGQLNIRQL
ncbi:Formin-like protein 6 [Acorus calamus]|uniref:Formin-like protein n=1 Tax=Acorus calamus TaxID=4465 RepID=A0AAV9CYY6_ACOCL|nr:Formin-like protein 6 [Acorus calamus]